ncbi:MAG: hypothetical protein RIS94_464 [Pseudomonadota bacterium]|jgi:Ca2+-binding EF-hand superfamily protein
MRKFTLAAAASALALAGTAAYFVTPALAQMDMSGKDRTITWTDAKAKADEAWTRLDVNKDGKLDQADRDAKMVEMFDKIDTNHDGAISRDEFLAHHRAMMMNHDKDGHPGPDGRPPMAGMDHEGHDGHEGHGGPGGMMDRGPMHLLEMADANKDGTVTRAEYDAAVKAHFDAADTNHDGKITPEERRAAFGKMRARDGESMHPPMGGQMPPPPSGDQ